MNEWILLPQDIARAGKIWLEDKGYKLKYGKGILAEQMAEDVSGCSAIIARLGNYSKEVMEAEPMLKVIARHGAGYDNIDIEAARQRGVWVTYDPFSNTNAVAEHIVTLILGCAKRLVFLDGELRRGNFKARNEFLTAEVEGKTLGIAGFGRIGQAVARKAGLGLGMNILAYDPVAKEVTGAELCASLEELLVRSDYVSVNMPCTPQTKGIFGRAAFQSMKKTAFFINGARGELVDEEALLWALREREIAGAATDVFEIEPPHRENPLFLSESLIVSPHNAALTVEAMNRMALTAAKAVDDVLSGRIPEFIVTEGRQPNY